MGVSVNELPAQYLTDEIMSDAKAFSDTAVVLVNAVNPMELGFLEKCPQIKGALSIGAVGNTGMYAVGEILSSAAIRR